MYVYIPRTQTTLALLDFQALFGGVDLLKNKVSGALGMYYHE